MKIRCFEDRDALLIEPKPGDVSETRDPDEDAPPELDAKGQVLAIALEPATRRVELGSFSFDRVTV